MFIASDGGASVGSSPMDAEWTRVTSAGPPSPLTSSSARCGTSSGSDDWFALSTAPSGLYNVLASDYLLVRY
jgi:hypothetical protein